MVEDLYREAADAAGAKAKEAEVAAKFERMVSASGWKR
jgi:hypothetical protein